MPAEAGRIGVEGFGLDTAEELAGVETEIEVEEPTDTVADPPLTVTELLVEDEDEDEEVAARGDALANGEAPEDTVSSDGLLAPEPPRLLSPDEPVIALGVSTIAVGATMMAPISAIVPTSSACFALMFAHLGPCRYAAPGVDFRPEDVAPAVFLATARLQ